MKLLSGCDEPKMVFGRFLLLTSICFSVNQEQHLWGASCETGLCGRFLNFLGGEMGREEGNTINSTWGSLFKASGIAAILAAVMYLITLIVYVPANLASPPPETVLDWFEVFQTNQITGLFFLGIGDVVIMLLWIPIVLGLYKALNQVNQTWTLIATMFAFVGIAVFIATNTAFSMLSLSQEYAIASSEAQKVILLSAGEAMLAVTRGTGHLYTGMNLTWLAGFILSVVMLRGNIFNRATAWVGILGLGLLVAGIVGGGHYTSTGEYSALQGAIVAIQYIGGGFLSLAWYIMIGLRLWKLGAKVT